MDDEGDRTKKGTLGLPQKSKEGAYLSRVSSCLVTLVFVLVFFLTSAVAGWLATLITEFLRETQKEKGMRGKSNDGKEKTEKLLLTLQS